MTHNFNVKIKTGPRTPLDVTVYSTAVNDKQVDFNFPKPSLNSQQLADIIEVAIKRAIK